MTLREHRIDVDGLPTRYLLAAGEDGGPPLILLHGVGDNALDWRWVMAALARSRRVNAPVRRGPFLPQRVAGISG